MAVGYRSLLHADPGQHLVDVLVEHLNRWMAGKDIAIDAGTSGRYQLDYGNVITIVNEDCEDGLIYGWTRQHPEAHPREVLRSTFTALERPDSDGWLWCEIETQDDPYSTSPTSFASMSVPRVLRTLLGVLALRDGRTDVAAEPLWVSSAHLPDVMDYLADETRLGAVYIASQGPAATEHFEHWVTEVSWHLVGLGSVLMLDSTVASEFNEMVGERHVVPVGTMRTYLPNVDLDDLDDPPRHRILGSTRINMTEPRRLAGMLGLAARVRAAELPLPAEVAELDRIIQAREHATVPTGDPVNIRVNPRANLHAVPMAEHTTEAQILAKLEALEQEIHELRTALGARSSSNGHRQLSVS